MNFRENCRENENFRFNPRQNSPAVAGQATRRIRNTVAK
jgi:hypothetical protein